MALRADFEVIEFREHLGDKKGDLSTPYPFLGDASSVRNFFIGSPPKDDAFITLQVFDVQDSYHRIKINGMDLPGWDIALHGVNNRWYTWTDIIPRNYLRTGNNTVQILRNTGSGDNFIINYVIINWREDV